MAKRVLVAALIDDTTNTMTFDNLKALALTFTTSAWPDHAHIPEIMLTAEGDAREPLKTKGCMIGFTDRAKLQIGINAIEGKKSRSNGRGGPDVPHILLGVGSKDFCQSFIHFWATGRSGGSPWGYHLLRRLSQGRDGEIVWVDTKTGELTEANFTDMVVHTMQVAAESDKKRHT